MVNGFGKFGNALVGTFVVFAGNKRDNIATIFRFDAGAITVFLLGAATIDAGGTLELAEGIANSFIATA